VALWNEILEGSLNQLIAKRLGMQVGAPAPAVTPEIGCNITLESDRVEWGYLKGELLCGAQGLAPAVAGNFSQWNLVNPANSGSLFIIERIGWQMSGANGLMYVRPGSAPGTLITPAARDSRWNLIRPTATCNVGSAAAAPPEAVIDRLWAGATPSDRRGVDIVLKPNSFLQVQGDVINQSLFCIVQWRERGALPGELG